MKKYLVLFLMPVLLIFSATAQNTLPQAVSMTFLPFQSSRVHSSDSVRISFFLISTNTAASVVVSQTSGPTVKYTTDSTWLGNNEMYGFWLKGLAPGNYSFSAVGKDVAGNTTNLTQSLTVVADPVCPVCAACPAQRAVSSFTINIAGVTVTIPAGGLVPGAIKYNDGSSQ